MEPGTPSDTLPQSTPPSGYEGVWPPPPTVPASSYGAVQPSLGMAFPFKTEFRYVQGSVPLFRSGTLWLSPYGLAIQGKAVPRYEIQVPILVVTIVLGAGWVIAYLIMEYAIRTDAALDLAWDRVQQVVLSPKKRRVCLVYDAPDYKGVVKPYSLTTNLPGPQYDAFVEAARPHVSDRMLEGKPRNWTSPVVWVVCAGILLAIAFYIVLFAAGSLAPTHPTGGASAPGL